MASGEIENLIKLLSKLPGLGPRSARRAALYLVKYKETKLHSLQNTLKDVYEKVKTCAICGNFDTASPCEICSDEKRDPSMICVVGDVSDVWALERTNIFKGRYHILGGLLSALDGVGPDNLNIPGLLLRAKQESVTEIIFALPATVEGKTTEHYVSDLLRNMGLKISELAHGVPVGGELDYLDDGTIGEAIKARRVLS